MFLSRDLTDRRWIILKGMLFSIIVVLSGAQIVIEDDVGRRFLLLPICIWAACRFYYFLFYVLERYVGVEGRYAGICDLCCRLWARRRENGHR